MYRNEINTNRCSHDKTHKWILSPEPVQNHTTRDNAKKLATSSDEKDKMRIDKSVEIATNSHSNAQIDG